MEDMEFGLLKASTNDSAKVMGSGYTTQNYAFLVWLMVIEEQACFFSSRVCRLNGYRSHQHRMLHEDGDDNKTSLN